MPNEPESPEFRYKTPVDQCDVVDRKKLEQYRDKRYEWLSWYELRKGEPNTIQQQLFSMMFLDMAYRILASARQSVGQEVTFSAQSGLLAHFLDQGYVATQVLAIRKLLDGRKDVFSLRRLLEDISDHRKLITRENYVCHDGLGTPKNRETAFLFFVHCLPLLRPKQDTRDRPVALICESDNLRSYLKGLGVMACNRGAVAPLSAAGSGISDCLPSSIRPRKM